MKERIFRKGYLPVICFLNEIGVVYKNLYLNPMLYIKSYKYENLNELINLFDLLIIITNQTIL